jgi:crotonobetainyl-CoA:carnitine CoA-transferase CaiB-like acyl-CoA transferase
MDLLRAATQVLRQLKDTGEAATEQALLQQRDAYRAEWRRLKQMMASALSEDDAKRWASALQEMGLSDVQLRPLECPLGLVAWNIQAGA